MLAGVPAARLAASLPCTRARGLAVPRAKMAGGAQAGRAAPVTGFGAALPQQRARVGDRPEVGGRVGPLSRLPPQDGRHWTITREHTWVPSAGAAGAARAVAGA